jgi:hypothetical protein
VIPDAGSAQTLPGRRELAARAREVLDAHWQPEGYTVPNLQVYPHQWLWDSCFHAIVWAHLGDGDRAIAELRNVFAHQAEDGFVPHMTYWRAPQLHEGFWGRRWTSSITQPPMYGHAIAELTRLGVAVDEQLVAAARQGLTYLLHRTAPDGSVLIVHPWETGCDDSPRWDAWCDDPWSPVRWKERKGELVASLRFDARSGSPVGNPGFEVGACAFEALVAFNALELCEVIGSPGDAAPLRRAAQASTQRMRDRWDATRATFRDHAVSGALPSTPASSGVRTLEALLPALVLGPHDDRAGTIFAQVLAPDAFGGSCGPAQVHRAEPGFSPAVYWRGSAWPQLSYLLWVAARRSGRPDVADRVRDTTIRGAVRSGFAEHWHPDSGAGLGAVPQSWTGLVAAMA